jgi:hypothetical protein
MDSQLLQTTTMDSIEPNQLSNTLDLTSSTLLPVTQRWSHDPEISRWFAYERTHRQRNDPFKVRIILKAVYNRIED